MPWNPSVPLTNRYFELRIEPRHGGRITSLATPNGELTVAPAAADLARPRIPDRFGLLSVQLWADSYWHNDLCHLEWPVISTDLQPGRSSITLAGTSRRWPGVAVERTVVVTGDPWIDVAHRLDPGSMTGPYRAPAFWFSNVMRGRGRTFVPGPAGALGYPRWPQDQSWCHEPTEGWIAWIGETGGLAVISELAHLRHVRLCHLHTDRVEWIRRGVPTVEQAQVRLVPFSGLDHVDGAGAAGILAVEQTAGGLAVDVYALLTGAATLELELVAPDGATTSAGTTAAGLVAGSVTRLAIPLAGWPSSAAGGWWRGTLTMSPPGAGSATFAAPAVGSSRYLRGMLPATPQVVEVPLADDAHLQPPRSFTFDAAPVPLPAPWLRRQGARPRVLALTDLRSTATLLALAHQFDLELTLPYVPRNATLPTTSAGIAGQQLNFDLGGRFKTLYGDELVAVWASALASTRTYDVILLDIYPAGDAWRLLPQSLQAEILARVQSGTGLVVVRRGNPGGPNPEADVLRDLLPLALVHDSEFAGPCHPADERTVRGLPWAVTPSSAFIWQYSTRPGATVLVEVAPKPTDPSVRIPLLARTSYGTGRVLDLVWGPHVVNPFTPRQLPAGAEGMEPLRYDLALLARVIQDASGRAPAIAVRQIELLGTTATVELEQVDAAAGAFSLDWVARDRFGTELGRGSQSSSVFPAGGVVTLSIPSGTWITEVVILPSTGEPGWGAGATILDFAVGVSPEVTVLGHGDTVDVTPAGPAAAALHVVDLVDGRQRVVSRQLVAAGATATMRPDRVETPHAELRVHALDAAGLLIGQTSRTLRVRMRTGMNGWPIYFWNNPLVFPTPLFVRHLDANAALGMSAFFRVPDRSPAGSPIVSAADRLAIPYVLQASGWLRTSGGQAPDGSGRPLSLTDGEAIATGTAADTAFAAAWADTNVLYYALGDDESHPPLTDVSHDPQTITRFRAWLSDAYGHADSRLQAEWRTKATFAEATPSSYAEAVAAFDAPGGLSYAPWVDHRRFMMDLFSRAPAEARRALRRGDPLALAGTSGENFISMAAGRDWWVRGRALDVAAVYASSTTLILEALGTPSIRWTAYDDPDPIIRHRIWSAVGQGEDGLALFNEATLVNPDLTLPETGRDLAAALLPFRRGAGALFARSRQADDGVFVLASPDSAVVLAIHGYELLGEWLKGPLPKQNGDLGTDGREYVHDLLSAMGVGWSLLSPADVEAGALERNGARVLILPMCIALSDAACEAIRRWVAAGGHAVADLFPGVFNDHGRLRGNGISPAGAVTGSTNPLDAVFGVTPGARPPIVQTPVPVTVGGASPFPVRCVDTAVAATSGATAGGTAAGASLWFRSPYQRGSGSYLGCSIFADYYQPRELTWRAPMEEAFSALLLGLGVQPRASAVTGAGKRIPLCQLRARSLDTTELIVFLRDWLGSNAPLAAEVDGEIRFRGVAHTYDVDSGVYLGFGDRLPLRVGAYTFRALARLPYRVEGIDVAVSGTPRLGGSLTLRAQLTVSGAWSGRHLLRLDVLAPGGRPLRYLAREVMADCGAAWFDVPVAFNDPPGPWTIVVSDVSTGVRGEVEVHLASSAPPVVEPEPLQVDAIDD